jgi:hypothetical protein
MSANTLRRSSIVLLATGLAFTFVTAADADNGRKIRSSESKVPTLDDALFVQFDIVEMSASTLATTTNLMLDSQQIVHAVRNAVDAGKARVLYTLESPLIVGTPLRLQVGSREPYITKRKTKSGDESRISVQYDDIGCIVYIRSKWIGSTPQDAVYLNWNVEVSDFRTESGVRIGDNPDVPRFVEREFTFSTIVSPGETIAFRAGTQRTNIDDAQITVVIASLSAVQPGSSKK